MASALSIETEAPGVQPPYRANVLIMSCPAKSSASNLCFSLPAILPWNERRICMHAFPETKDAAGSVAPGIRVLLVDDHEDTNRSLTLLLGRRGYKVRAATSLATAEALCDLETFDVLVCDMNLPDGSGLQLLGRLVTRPPRLGAIILSGYNTDEDIDRSLAAGYKAHLGKPVDLDKLDQTIKRLGQ